MIGLEKSRGHETNLHVSLQMHISWSFLMALLCAVSWYYVVLFSACSIINKKSWLKKITWSVSIFKKKKFGGIFMSPRCFLDFSVSVWAFFMGLSQISSFFSYWKACIFLKNFQIMCWQYRWFYNHLGVWLSRSYAFDIIKIPWIYRILSKIIKSKNISAHQQIWCPIETKPIKLLPMCFYK